MPLNPTTSAPAESGPIRLPVHEDPRQLHDDPHQPYLIVDSDQQLVAYVPSTARGALLSTAIVTALNATAQHDKLVAALEEITFIAHDGGAVLSASDAVKVINNIARAVLATEKEVG